jgi:hypothetical protein
MTPPLLSRRALNRALLERQMLFERRAIGAREAVEHLVGMQAQEPQAPYLGLCSRLEEFRPQELSELISRGDAVRAPLMRATIHLVSAEDYRRLWPLMHAVLAASFRGSAFRTALAGIDLDEVLQAGRELLAEQPRTRAELSPLLAQRWPQVDPTALAYAVSFLTPIVHVPPRGLWRQNGPARFALADTSVKTRGDGMEGLIRRYLAAFGPATVRDIQAWCGLTRLREVIERVRSELVTFRDEDGNELFDVPGAPLPDPGAPAPPRFLPPFDNAILAHADRTRIVANEHRNAISGDRLMRTFLVDGFVAGTWRLEDGRLRVQPFTALTERDRASVADEADRALAFLVPGVERELAFSDRFTT